MAFPRDARGGGGRAGGRGARGGGRGNRGGEASFGTHRAASQVSKPVKQKSFKNKIRDVERLLKRGGLDAASQARQEEMLEYYKQSQAVQQRKLLEIKYAVRYHKVRFFERVKVDRRRKKLQAQLAALPPDSPEHATLSASLEAAEKDLEYVLFFPRGEKYVSLLKNAKAEEDEGKRQEDLARLRALAAERRAAEAQLTEADEGASLRHHLARLSSTTAGYDVEDETDDFFLAETLDADALDSDPDGSDSDAAPSAKESNARESKAKEPAIRRPAVPSRPPTRPTRPSFSRAPLDPSFARPLASSRPQRPAASREDHRKPPAQRRAPEGGAWKNPPAQRRAPEGGAWKKPPTQRRAPKGGAWEKPPGPPRAAAAAPEPKPGTPARSRAEGGRKRRKKSA